MVYSALPIEVGTPSEQISLSSAAWNETLEQLIDDTTMAFARSCMALDIPEPSSVGYELTHENGEVIGEAELAWDSQKIVFLAPGQHESEGVFISNGWIILKHGDETPKSLWESARS